MKNYIAYTLIAFFLTLSGCTKTETPETTAQDSCKMQIDSLKAEIAALKKAHVRHASHLQASKFKIDTTQLQQNAHLLEEQQDEANEADHQTDTIGTTKVTVNSGKNNVVVQTIDTTKPVVKKSIFEKIKGIFVK